MEENDKVRKYKNKAKMFPVYKTLTKYLDMDYIKPQRAGVILYTVYNNYIYFGFGLDSNTHDLTDFGGSVYYNIDKNVLNGALREFKEETLDIFTDINIDDIQNCPVIYDNKNLILFIRIDINPNYVSQAFHKKYLETLINNPSQYIEVCGITWLTLEELNLAINNRGINKGTLFHRVQNFLYRARDFTHLL